MNEGWSGILSSDPTTSLSQEGVDNLLHYPMSLISVSACSFLFWISGYPIKFKALSLNLFFSPLFWEFVQLGCWDLEMALKPKYEQVCDNKYEVWFLMVTFLIQPNWLYSYKVNILLLATVLDLYESLSVIWPWTVFQLDDLCDYFFIFILSLFLIPWIFLNGSMTHLRGKLHIIWTPRLKCNKIEYWQSLTLRWAPLQKFTNKCYMLTQNQNVYNFV